MDNDFYSTSAQLKREVRGRWRRLEYQNLLQGTLITVLGFYAFHHTGKSQVYDVALPFIIAALHLTILVFGQTQPERAARTAAFFHNLPRDRETALGASAIYFLAHALFYELVIALGVYLKLGGADITPVYRLHPEIAVLPIATVLGALLYCSRPRSFRTNFLSVGASAGLFALLLVRNAAKPAPTIENNFLPPRDFPLPIEWIAAALILGLLAGACWHIGRTRGPLKGANP